MDSGVEALVKKMTSWNLALTNYVVVFCDDKFVFNKVVGPFNCVKDAREYLSRGRWEEISRDHRDLPDKFELSDNPLLWFMSYGLVREYATVIALTLPITLLEVS